MRHISTSSRSSARDWSAKTRLVVVAPEPFRFTGWHLGSAVLVVLIALVLGFGLGIQVERVNEMARKAPQTTVVPAEGVK